MVLGRVDIISGDRGNVGISDSRIISGWGSYQFDNYDELADSPFELGPVWKGRFTTAGVPHEFAVALASPAFGGDRLLADTQKICRTQIAFWHGKKKPPHSRYAFLLAAVEDGYGGFSLILEVRF